MGFEIPVSLLDSRLTIHTVQVVSKAYYPGGIVQFASELHSVLAVNCAADTSSAIM